MAQRKFIIDGGFKTDDASELLANLSMGGHILPTVDSDGTTGFDLGSTALKWRDLYLSQGSLYINNQKVLEDDSGTIVVRADIDQGITVKAEGTGVLTLASTTPIAMAATLQMASGKNITDADGVAVQFGDKINMNGNTIIGVGTAVNTTDVTNKAYVDQQVANVINGAPGALDTLNELANALGDDANFSTTVTNSLATNATAIATNLSVGTANTTGVAANAAAIIVNQDAITAEKVLARTNESAIAVDLVSEQAARIAADAIIDTAVALRATSASVTSDIATAITATESVSAAYTDNREVAITTAFQAYADSATSSGAVTSANNYTDAEIATATTSITTALQSYADTAETDAIASAEAKDVALTTALQSYADQAETDAVAEAETKDAARATAANAYADTAEADAIATASADATSKANAALASAQTYADTAESDAISTSATDATTKANQALVDAKAYADTAEADAISTAAADATAKVLVETNARTTADSTLTSNLATETARIDSILSASTSDADTFAEIVTLVNSVDATNDSVLAGEVAARIAGDSSTLSSAQSYADTAEADAIASAEAKDVARATQAGTDIATAKAQAIAAAYAYADQAETDAESAASSDATTKADAALAAAKVYADNGDANTTYTAGNGMTLSGTQFLMSGSYTGSFTATGDITAYSDDSLKTNVQVIDGALGRVEAIRGVTFERIEDGSVSTGVIAQELKAVLPEAVHTDANGVHSVAYGNITGLLIEAVKELSAQVAELKAK